MFSRLNKTIIDAIESVMNDSVCNFGEWWKDDFETEIYFEDKNDLKNLSDTDLEIANDCQGILDMLNNDEE